MNKSTGGPAFPCADSQTAHAIGAAAVSDITDVAERDRAYTIARGQALQGMTLRDYFAAQALATVPGYASQDIATWGHVDFAKHAYQIADAMLEERAK